MSTTSLPSYRFSLDRTPPYTYEPHETEQRIAFADRLLPRPSGSFVKSSKTGSATLRLTAQEDTVTLPVYGSGALVEGSVDLSKPESVTRVEVKVEGHLRLREIAEGGHSTAKLCSETHILWVKDQDHASCPASLRFFVRLPDNFIFEEKTYRLPPTFNVQLDGLPGFTANIDYAVSAVIHKPGPMRSVTSKAMGLLSGTTTINTPFIYYPRTRPAIPLPPPLEVGPSGFIPSVDWTIFDSTITSRQQGLQDITTKLYLPSSRIYGLSAKIPFHLTLHSSAVALAAYLPMSPTANILGRSRATRLQLMRQSSVDVKNVVKLGAKREMWRVDTIGEGHFRLIADAPSWIAFSGEIVIDRTIKTPGFKAAGLGVKDFILLTFNPPDPLKSPFMDLRQVIAVRLTTDPWTPPNGASEAGRPSSLHSAPSSQEGATNPPPVSAS